MSSRTLGYLLLPLCLSSMSPAIETAPLVTIETRSAECQGAEAPRSTMAVSGDTLVITEPLATPTPCYRVTGEVTVEPGRIVVTLQSEQRPGMCIECLGVVVGEVRISRMPQGTYEVEVQTPERVTRRTLEIGEPSSS